jgi:integrase/recombinase XerD
LFPGVDDFIDALWLEEGLSGNTLAAYRRDLTLYAGWQQARGRSLEATTEADLNAYFAHRHAGSKASTANRRLTVFKRFFRWGCASGSSPSTPRCGCSRPSSRCACPRP